MMVLIPALELAGNQGPSLADAPRAALSAASRVLDTRHPVYVLITGMEDVPGFLEFVRRMPAGQRDVGRCGFAIPAGPQPIHKRDASAFARFLQWYDVNMLDLVADEPLNQEGNEGLVGLGRWFHDIHPTLLGILDAIADAGEEETVDLLGCYFTANGPVPERRAFTASTLRGRVVGDPHSARWAPETIATDRSHRKYAWIVAAVSASLLLPLWAYILFGIGSQEVVVAGWIILFATIAGWCITCYKILKPASSSTNA